jgi:hypothetical protein
VTALQIHVKKLHKITEQCLGASSRQDIPDGTGHKNSLLAAKCFIQWVGQPAANDSATTEKIIGYEDTYEELPGIELTDMAPSLPSRQVRRRVLTMMSKREMRGYEGDIQLPLPIPNSLGYII